MNDIIGCLVNIQYRSSHLQLGHCDRLIDNSYFLTIRMNHYENRYFRKIASKFLFKTMPYKDMYVLKSFCKMLTYLVLIFINCFYGNWCFLNRDKYVYDEIPRHKMIYIYTITQINNFSVFLTPLLQSSFIFIFFIFKHVYVFIVIYASHFSVLLSSLFSFNFVQF